MAGSKPVQMLWEDYHFLTKELLKFIDKQNMELFHDLLNQREELQVLIRRTSDDDFNFSLTGQKLIKKIQQDNQAILEAMQILMGSTKRQHQVSKAYSAASTTAVNLMNRKR